VAACLACGGVWLDPRTSNEVKTAFGDWAIKVADHAARVAQVAVDTTSHQALACPSCRSPMRKARVPGAGFEIDVCDPHGTFYDRGELAAALKVVTAAKKAPPKRLYSPAAIGVGAVAAVAAVGVTGAAAMALSNNPSVGQQMMSSGTVDVAETALEVAEVAVDVLDVVDVAEVGGAVLEGGVSVFGFLGELLGGIDF
jgi:Zn-finger nucleic acid-binding protein